MTPLVSIIIPTHNSARTIGQCLASILRDMYPRKEIIVVDNRSTDATRTIVAEYPCIFLEWHTERTFQKNQWLARATGDYVLFVDSDMEFSGNILGACVHSWKKGVIGVMIPERSIGDTWLSRVREYERSWYAGTSVEAPRFFLREDVLRVGGYTEGVLLYEDYTVWDKLSQEPTKEHMARIDAFLWHHEFGMSWWSWMKKKYRYGASYAHYWTTPHANLRRAHIGERVMIFVKNPKFFARPWLALGVIFLKCSEYIAGGIGYGKQLLTKHHD